MPTAASIAAAHATWSDTHDVRIVCRDGRVVTAHRSFLSQQSPFMHRLLYGPMRPAVDENLVMTAELDQEYADIEAFVAHCYHGVDSLLPIDLCAPLLALAREYETPALTARCTAKLIEVTSAANAVDFLLYGSEYGLSSLLSAARHALITSFTTIVNDCRGSFVRCPLLELQAALRSDQLDVCREEEAFNAVCAWAAEHKPPEGTHLDLAPLLMTLRYATMASASACQPAGPTRACITQSHTAATC